MKRAQVPASSFRIKVWIHRGYVGRRTRAIQSIAGFLLAGGILAAHAWCLAYGAAVNSPTVDEVAHLPAGITHWHSGRFELYRVNPPLVRMVAAVPVLAVKPRTNWAAYSEEPFRRPEFQVGRDFVRANGERAFWLFARGRWACIPFSLLGAYVCYRWASELFGWRAALVALALWCFCPNILGHGQLITPDVAGAALAVAVCYVFWHWLRQPSWQRTGWMGVLLGVAELTKTTNLLLFVLLPVLWLLWPVGDKQRSWRRESVSLLCMFGLALLVLNVGYGFEGTLKPLGEYLFTSKAFGGTQAEASTQIPGNRFAGSWLGRLPVPLPENYVRGIDVQKRDFESGRISYLRGEYRRQGWWYYYLYAMLVKVPLGTWLLFACAGFFALWYGTSAGWRNEVFLVLPALGYLGLVSSETGFSHHLRYVLPVFPFWFIWISRLAAQPLWKHKVVMACTLGGLLWSVASSLSVYPHSLSYFNELAGGPKNGPRHLLDSNVDWGQDLLFLKRWADQHSEARPLYLSYFGMFDASAIYPELRPISEANVADGPRPGWYAVSVNTVYGYAVGGIQREPMSTYSYFQQFEPVAYAGYSIYVYHVTWEEANRVRARLGLPPLPAATAAPSAEPEARAGGGR